MFGMPSFLRSAGAALGLQGTAGGGGGGDPRIPETLYSTVMLVGPGI